MSYRARLSTPVEGAKQTALFVPVVFDNGVALIGDSVPLQLAGTQIPRELSTEWCERHGLRSDPGSTVTLRSLSDATVSFVSLGSSYNDLENWRLAGASAVRNANGASLTFFVPTDGIESCRDATQALVEGALLASYSFKDASSEVTFDVVALGSPLPSVETHNAVTNGVERGIVVGDGVNWAKRLIDTPPGDLGPRDLARKVVRRLEDDSHVHVDAWNENKIKEERLGGVLGVGQGSAQPSRLVYATYDPEPGGELAHVALVGKGVTFDSGGLSIKSGEGMMTMKTDMTGAAIVMSVLSMASRLGLRVRVSAIAPMVENMSGDKALRPGDVLTIRNNMTIEVLNTDAEGRLILADGLSLAVEANPDAIIDVATLTGAQSVALGDEVGALYASTDELAHLFEEAGKQSGELLWRMPLVQNYEAHIDSDIADMKNIGKAGRAGSISAALLLRRFTDNRPWAHLDIAGPARSDAVRGYTTKGATAFSARTLLNFLQLVADSTKA